MAESPKATSEREETNPNLKVFAFPEEVLKRILGFVRSHKGRNSASLVCKGWYEIERISRRHVFIGNCYSVSPETVVRRFPNVRSITLKGKPRFSDFNLVPPNWGADVQPWIVLLAKACPHLEELRLKRMTVTDDSLDFIALSFPNFRALSLVSCDGFSTDGIASIASYCRNLTELDIQENDVDDLGGDWLSFFPESFASLEILNFASLNSEVNFDALERLVSRCNSLRILKVNKCITPDQLQRLLIHVPNLIELGTGSFLQEGTQKQIDELGITLSNCKKLQTLSGLWKVSPSYIPVISSACRNLTFLNLAYASLQTEEFAQLVAGCPQLRRLWVLDTIKDEGLEAVGSACPVLEELRVFPASPFEPDLPGVTESGFIAVSIGCPNLKYVLYFCTRMTNASMKTIAENCPNFTHFRLCILAPYEPDYLTNEPMDEGFGAVVEHCNKIRRLSVSGLLTDRTFEYIGMYAKNLETLSIAFAGSGDFGMQCLFQGCPKLRRLEIRDCPFGDAALLSGMERYESMRSLWMSACKVTMNACRTLARAKPRLNVEVIEDGENDEVQAEKVYAYRTTAGPRSDAPPFVLTL